MKLIILLTSVYLFACKSSKKAQAKNENPIKIKLHEGIWISNFKNEVFIRCLKLLYGEKMKDIIENKDASTMVNKEWLKYDVEIIKKADSLSNQFIKNLKHNYSLENKTVIINICLAYRNSISLDKFTFRLYI